MSDEYSAVLGGGLSLKGGLFKDSSKKKKKTKKRKHDKGSNSQDDVAGTNTSSQSGEQEQDSRTLSDEANAAPEDSSLTPAQKRFKEQRKKRDERLIKSLVKKTHRERVEDFNSVLATMTEHNDIPRVSAAGNG